MAKFFLLLPFLLIPLRGIIAQDLPAILVAAKPKKGIYRTFEEFRNNAPSIQANFELVSRSKSKQYLWGGSEYALITTDSAYVERNEKKYWGVSTGDSVYVNVSSYQKARGYIKLESLGRYCYTKAYTSKTLEGNNTAAVLFGITGAALSSILHEVGIVLNINNGKFLMLDDHVMQYILSRDKELSDAYRQDPKKKLVDTRLAFIARYNQTHRNEIGEERTAKVIFYRREHKERPDTINLEINGSMYCALLPGQFHSFEVNGGLMTVCAKDQCKDYQINFEGINYLKCLFWRGESRIQIVEQDPIAAEMVVNQLSAKAQKKKVH